MDWYYENDMNDLLVPKDQDLSDRLPSPDSWSKWGISAPEGFNLPKRFWMMDTSPREVDFNFNDESFISEIEIESSRHDNDQSSSSSLYGGLPEQSFHLTALSCNQPKYQLQDLSGFEQMDHIFLYKRNLWTLILGFMAVGNSLLDDLPDVENLNRSLCSSPEFLCGQKLGGPQKDSVDSKFVPCDSKPEEGLDIGNDIDEDTLEQSSLEEYILQDLEMVIAQFTEKTRIRFREALYRLARSTNQQHLLYQHGDLNMENAMPHMDHNETVRSMDKKPMESDTNSVDRAIANLMYNKMEINVQERPLTSSLVTKATLGKRSRTLNEEQNFHYPNTANLLADVGVPGFGGSD